MSVVTRIRTSQELTVPFTLDEVWGVLADVHAYPEWWPRNLDVEVLHHNGGLLGAEFEVRPRMGRMFRIRFEELEGRQSMRLRFFGGALEGPGGFHLNDLPGGGTHVRYEMDVFARGLDVAVLSQVLPVDWIHSSRMKGVLNRLAGRLKTVREIAERQVATEQRRDLGGSPPSNASGSNFDIARRYVEALSSSAGPDEIASFFAAEAIQEEFPHRFLEAGATRGPSEILHDRGRALTRFSSPRYELAGATGGGSQVAMEARFKGRVAKTDETYREGQELDARLAAFLKFDNGKIVRERIYTCFEPWSNAAERRITLDERVAQAGQSSPVSSSGANPGPPVTQGSTFEIARAYLEELGTQAGPEAIARFFAPEAVQEEFPNRLLQTGAHRDLLAIKLARSRSLAFLSSQTYELLGATGGGSMVALEAGWTGVVRDGFGLFAVGQKLEARLAIFLKLHNGLIVAQRNYMCAYDSASAHGVD